MKIAVIGDGGWGTANALLLVGYGHDVTVWGAFPDYIEEQRRTRRNEKFLKGVVLPDALKLTADREEAVKGAEIVVLAPPSKFFASVMEGFKGLITDDQLVVSLTKGLCETSNKRMTELAKEILGLKSIVALAGPTHAEEVSRGIPTTIVAACEDEEKAKKVQRVWSGPKFRVYTSPDPVGVEIGGAVKNVIAIAVGCSDGMGFGDNAKAALMTRGITEMCRLGAKLGANIETFSGLTGIGDLIVTCTSMHSRNRRCGIMIGEGMKPSDATEKIGMVVEGMFTAEAAYQLAQRVGAEMPITECIYKCINEEIDAKEAVELLMGRDKKNEMHIG